MKFLRVAGVHYPQAKKRFEAQINEASSYQETLQAIFSHQIHYTDSLTSHLQSLGYEAQEILCDLEGLQKKWAKENGAPYTDANWQMEILVQQIQKFQPEILYLHNIYPLPLAALKRRKELFPSIRKLAFFRGYPEINKPLFNILSTADLLLVGSPVLERICRRQGLEPHLFPHYFDERILQSLPRREKSHPFTFIGTSGYGYGWNHQPRYQYLKELLKTTAIECWLEEQPTRTPAWKEFVKKGIEEIYSWLPESSLRSLNENISLYSPFRKFAFNGLAKKLRKKTTLSGFPDVPLQALFPNQCHVPVFGKEMHETLASSHLTFNKHSFSAQGTVDNIRLFEATGVGTCLITDAGTNLPQLFQPDEEVVVYESIEECREKVDYLLRNKEKREEIARKGQARTLREHTAFNRAKQMDALLS